MANNHGARKSPRPRVVGTPFLWLIDGGVTTYLRYWDDPPSNDIGMKANR